MENKISAEHKRKLAYIYLRQSTMGQVRLNQESTERQYALKNRALSLGWPEHQVKVLDNDLGLSGSKSDNREDFKTLVANVSMGRVGAIFALEASRLSRSCTDWHRLLEICALTNTLILDEDGCYNPKDFNDQLLLGLKATMSQAELHFIRARLIGGKINKAKKGELRFPLPVGYCYDSQGQTVFDADEQVRECIALVFSQFKECGSAYGVAHFFRKKNISFPKRSYGGAWSGKLIWAQLTLARVLGILKNPSYAGAYTYGRYSSNKFLSDEGQVKEKIVKLPQSEWRVLIKDHHEAYISWDEYMDNQNRLRKNQTNSKETVLPGPAREGLAMLHGLLLCSYCGRRITVRYQGKGKVRPYYQCNSKRKDGLATKDCLGFLCEPVDQAIIKRALEIIEPEQIHLAIKAIENIEHRQNTLDKQWQLKLQRAEYEADLAQRRYEEVDPSNRLVAATLEKRWNQALEDLEQLKIQASENELNSFSGDISIRKAELLELAKDFPRLWECDSTKNKDRKRILRLLIKDIAVKKNCDKNEAELFIRWQGGSNEEMSVTLPSKSWEKWRHSPSTIERVRQLAQNMTDPEIVDQFNRESLKSNKGNPYTVSSIRWIRHTNNIPSYNQRKPGELTITEVAAKFNVSHYVVRYWIDRKMITARKGAGCKYLITLSAEEEVKLSEKVNRSTKIANARAKAIQSQD